jgi:hypothetical protein
MPNAKSFLNQTVQTASFAFREYSRPLVFLAFLLKWRLASAKPKESDAWSKQKKVSDRERDEPEA